MVVQAVENPSDCGSQKGKAKSPKRADRRPRWPDSSARKGLSYDDWRYVSRRVRQKCDLRPAAKPKRLPRVLTADQFRAFYKAVDAADDVQHALMLQVVVLHRRAGQRAVRHRGFAMSILRTARSSSTRGRGRRTGTSCSVGRLPRR